MILAKKPVKFVEGRFNKGEEAGQCIGDEGARWTVTADPHLALPTYWYTSGLVAFFTRCSTPPNPSWERVA